MLGGILPRDPLENLRSTGMVVDELGHVVDVVVDDDVQALFGGFVGGDLRGSEGLGHGGLFVRIRGLGFLSFPFLISFSYSSCRASKEKRVRGDERI